MSLPPSPSKNVVLKSMGRIQLRKVFCLGTLIGLLTVVVFACVVSRFFPSTPSISHQPTRLSTGKRKQLNAFVGIQSGFSRPRATDQYRYELRRELLRATWVPSSKRKLDAFEKEYRIRVRFIIGHSDDATAEFNLHIEMRRHRDIVQLPIQDDYLSLPYKTMTYLKYVAANFDAKFIVKIDDDVYFRLDRLPHAIPQWTLKQSDYIGCMKHGQVFKKPGYRWREPQHPLLGDGYYTHVWGCAYVMSGRAASFFHDIPDGHLRFLNNEDTTVGSWMLALNVSYYDDRRLCTTQCLDHSLAVFDYPRCAGLCEPHKNLTALHKNPRCQESPNFVPLRDEIIRVSLAKSRQLPPKREFEGVAI